MFVVHETPKVKSVNKTCPTAVGPLSRAVTNSPVGLLPVRRSVKLTEAKSTCRVLLLTHN